MVPSSVRILARGRRPQASRVAVRTIHDVQFENQAGGCCPRTYSIPRPSSRYPQQSCEADDALSRFASDGYASEDRVMFGDAGSGE